MFATASDLIAAEDIDGVLARITDRAALEVRAPRYLLAVRLEPDGEVHCHQRGFAPADAAAHAERLLDDQQRDFPSSWLVVPVRSNRREYGVLLAASDTGGSFFPQERELLEVYARYAASALDGAAALVEAKRRNDESTALLKLARALASAGTSSEVAQRLADAVPMVVDCDRVGVYIWDPGRAELIRRAFASEDPADPLLSEQWSRPPSPGGPIEKLLSTPGQEPMFIDAETGDAVVQEELRRVGDAAAILVPIATHDAFLGFLGVSVREDPRRLKPNPELLNRLSGVTAQATTALQNGRLVDQITHQATHDQLTGLANRLQFTDALRRAITRAPDCSDVVTVFYIDLDRFKPVNDEFGHEVGDKLLEAAAKRLRACTRTSDIVARLGGDEFAILVAAQEHSGDADPLQRRIEEAFRHPFTIDGHELRLTASVGRAVFPDDADDADSLLRKADDSMFAVKRTAPAGETVATR
jgi:diguanylate cyclase (GGDEF)-like protein